MTNEEVAKKIGENVKRYRKLRKYTQARVAEEIGIDRSLISKMETGKCLPAVKVLVEISRMLDIELICFFIGVSTL